MDGTDLRHEARPATGGVVDSVQLLHESGGVREGVVSLQQTLDQHTVRRVQQLWVALQLLGQLGAEGSWLEG